MPTTPLCSLASAHACFREQAASNGEFTTPLCPEYQLEGRDLEMHSVAPAIKEVVVHCALMHMTALLVNISCSQRIALNQSSLILKVIGVEDTVIAYSSFQVSYRGNDGNLVTKLVAFIGNSKEETQAFVLDEEVIFKELKGVKLKKID
ncbi:predicted protein [Chaetoceros tenuissimus]|uniref:Uncharacterized protein n=1 Tax=Chaetoceros tenuissimus TaxID=426638 RepID=A0AAD3D859_9STRA|nr:predicted protein [Chaetoceros tenuissimus]